MSNFDTICTEYNPLRRQFDEMLRHAIFDGAARAKFNGVRATAVFTIMRNVVANGANGSGDEELVGHLEARDVPSFNSLAGLEWR